MRAAHYAAVASGTPEKAIQEANNMYTEAEQQMKAVLNDLDGAIKYVINGEYEHPNRLDIIEGKTGSSTGPGTGFNKCACVTFIGMALGDSENSLVTNNIDVYLGPPIQPQPLQQPPASSPFGQPSTSTNAPGFGQPAFGQPSGFGQPTPIGGNQPGFGQSGFPQTQQGPGLGQPTPSPFAQASNQNQAGGFGQFSNQTVPGTGFGQLASNASSPFAQSKPEASPFGQATPAAPAPASNPFGAPAPTMNTPFAQPAPFASSAAPAPSTQQTSLQETKKSGFTRIIEKKLSGLPHLTGQTVHDPTTKKLRTWKGQPVTYVADDNPSYPHPQDPTVLVHIFFPDGPPLPATLKDAQAKDEEYTPDVEAAYKFAKQHGHFKDGVIPKVPPKSEWCSFDF